MRHEDLLRCPEEVVDALAKVGLKRDAVAFKRLEMLSTGYQIVSREQTLLREGAVVRAISDDVKQTLIDLLMPSGCEP